MIFYFSGTGNSRWIAQQLSNVQKEALVFIPEAMRNSTFEFQIEENETIGFVFPVYSWGVPSIVLRFIQNLILKSYHSQYIYFVCSCGDDIGLTRQMFCKALSRQGLYCNAGFSVIMPNNYVLLPGFDVDSKEVEQKKLAEAVNLMDDINGEILKRENLFRCRQGSFPFFKSRLINPLFNRFQISAEPFYATDRCISCKRCERACPVGNISVTTGAKPKWGTACTSCLACYHICPQCAVQYGKKTKYKGRYFHPSIE